LAVPNGIIPKRDGFVGEAVDDFIDGAVATRRHHHVHLVGCEAARDLFRMTGRDCFNGADAQPSACKAASTAS